MSESDRSLEERVADLERVVARLTSQPGDDDSDGSPRRRQHRERPPRTPHRPPAGVRRRSSTIVLGWPLWEIARGPDAATGERFGHARAVFAVGDRADGLVAVGGIARGGITIGGISLGLFSLGGLAFSLIAALGGVAVAPLAMGGVAVGGAARGGVAVGYYSWGPVAVGPHATRLAPPASRSGRSSRAQRRRDEKRIRREEPAPAESPTGRQETAAVSAGSTNPTGGTVAPRLKARVICFNGPVDSGSSCATDNYQPDGTLFPTGQMSCGHTGAVSELKWTFEEQRGDRDVYRFTRRFPVDAAETETTTATVELGDRRVIVFEDDQQVIIIEPVQAERP